MSKPLKTGKKISKTCSKNGKVLPKSIDQKKLLEFFEAYHEDVLEMFNFLNSRDAAHKDKRHTFADYLAPKIKDLREIVTIIKEFI